MGVSSPLDNMRAPQAGDPHISAALMQTIIAEVKRSLNLNGAGLTSGPYGASFAANAASPTRYLVQLGDEGSTAGEYEFDVVRWNDSGLEWDNPANGLTHDNLGNCIHIAGTLGATGQIGELIPIVVKDGATRWLFLPHSNMIRLRFQSQENDYLVCHSWDGTTEGTDAINVAKPWKLRHDKDNYKLLTTFTTTSEDEAEVTDGTDTEDWIITPSYETDDEIYAAVVGGTGVTVSSNDLTLIDLNVDGKAWAVKAV